MNTNYIYTQKEKDEILTRITRHLILNASFLKDVGLYHGKMGIAIFFMEYFGYTKETIYEEFAEELLDSILENVHNKLPIDMEFGLAGIGWGIEYLLKNKFITSDSLETFEDLDKEIFNKYHLLDNGSNFKNGKVGILNYLNFRNKLNNYTDKIKNEIKKNEILILINKHREEIVNTNILNKICLKKWNNRLTTELGINNGCSGIGLNLLFNEKINIHIY